MKSHTRKRRGDANLASEFFVASQLYRLGYLATITMGHTKEIDLVIMNHEGRIATIDVKGLKGKTSWIVMPKRRESDHFFVFVNYRGKFSDLSVRPEVYIVPSLEIDEILEPWKGKPEVTGIEYRTIKDSKYRDAWELLLG